MSCTNCNPEPCNCPIKDLGTDCSVYNQDQNLDEFNSPKGTILSTILQNINTAYKELKANVAYYFRVINVGTGLGIYKGIKITGEKEFKSLIAGTNINLVESEDEITVEAADTVADGSETIVNQGTNVTITGTGTAGDPYVINSTDTVADGSETIVNQGTNVTITGTGTAGDPYVINSTDTVADGSETKVEASTTTSVTGEGTTGNAYKVEVENLQTEITANHTLVDANNGHTIMINNGATPITVTIPTGLKTKFNCSFIQQGTGEVNFTASGTTINTPIGLKVEGQHYWAYIEQKLNTNVFQLVGMLKV